MQTKEKPVNLETLGLLKDKFNRDISSLSSRVTDAKNQAALEHGILENSIADTDARTDTIEHDVSALQFEVGQRVAGGYVDDDGYLILIDGDGEQIGDRIGPFAGGGGSGGGGGDVINAQLTVTNTTGWLSKTISNGSDISVSLNWTSVEDGIPTGDGAARITVNDIVRSTQQIHQGDITLDLKEYLSVGTNRVKIRISDVYDQGRTISYSITVVALSISSTFDTSNVFDGVIAFPYTPVGAVQKTIYFIVDNTIVGTNVTSVTGRQMTYPIPAQEHGGHSLRVYFEAEINNETVRSNELYYEFVSIESGDTGTVITSSFDTTEVNQYSTVNIPFRVYTPNVDTTAIKLYVNGSMVSEQTVDRTEQSYALRASDAGTVTFRIEAGNVTKDITFTVVESSIDVEAETEDLALYLTAYGRSNNEETRNVWNYNNISAQLTNFNWVQDGWQNDTDGIDVLRLVDDARVVIPYKLFGTDFKSTGKTIELEFATREVSDYTATILSCFADNIGLTVTPQSVAFKGAQTEISTLYKDNEHIRLAITVDKQNNNRLILVYINGIMSGAIQYASGERFSQLSPVNISIGSNDCGIDIYNIRVYDNNLSRIQILDNWIADTQIGSEMLNKFVRNDVYDAYGEITPANLPKDLPYFILEADELPQYKGDKKTISGSYTDPVYPSRSFTFEGCESDVQGTSSSVYYRKNYDLKFKKGFITSGGTVTNYALRVNSIPFNRFVLKADVASSESTNNTGLTMFYNDSNPYRTPEQVNDSRVRQGIEGIPIVVFWHNTKSGTTEFLGKFNFNLPKRANTPYGFSGNMESWEWERNNSANVKFQDNDFTTMKWDAVEQKSYPEWYDDFEARFPSDEWRDYTKLNAFISFVKSTWRDQTTNDNLSSQVTYVLNTSATVDQYPDDTSYTVTDEKDSGGASTGNKIITFTKDTPAYRLTKFRAEFPKYAEVDAFIYYYLFTEMFVMIDSRAKNMFIAFNGSTIADSDIPIDRKAVAQPYDMDTAVGTNNSGVLMFGYYLEDTDTVSDIISGSGTGGSNAPVFNAQDSVLWNNVRDAFRSEITQMYRKLRADNVWSYRIIEDMYEQHQSKWPEAIFNEDAYEKYLVPLVEPVTFDEDTQQYIKTDRYLTMLQGSKSEQRKWWLYNRFRYMDSKFATGDAYNKIISMRVFNSGRLTLTPAIDMYVAVSFGGGTTIAQQRTTTNTPVNFDYTTPSGVTEMETWIYSGDLITDVGDLSVFYPNELDFSKATKLKRLKIGSAVSGYSNANLRTFDVRNSTLLESIDCRNCPNLAITANLENSPRLVEAYFDNTSITGADFADGGALETLHLPGTITTLTLLNLNKLTDLQIASYANVSRLMLTNISQDIIDPIEVLQAIRPNSQVNIQGLYLEAENATEIDQFLDLLDTMQGVSREKNASGEWIYHDYDTAQVSGTIHTSTLTGAEIAGFNARYPYIRVIADHTTSQLKYYNGSTLLKTETILDGGNGTYTGSTPTKTQDAQYTYTFSGWSKGSDDNTVDSDALINVTADRNVYACFTSTVRTYTILWKNSDGTTLETDNNVPYGTTPTYNGSTPVNPTSGGGAFTGWTPSVASVTGNQTYTALYVPIYNVSFYNGSTLLQTVSVQEGGTAIYSGSTPVNPEDASLGFLGWGATNTSTSADAVLTNITANKSVYAVFESAVVVEEITDSWDTIIANIDNGTYATKYKIGNYKPLDLGTEGTINMQIVAKDGDELASGGTAPLTFLGMELLNTAHRMNATNTNMGGWPETELRSYLNTTIVSLVPSNVKSRIQKVNKNSKLYPSGEIESDETIWIPSLREIVYTHFSKEQNGVTYKNLYLDNLSCRKSLSNEATAYNYWTRSSDNSQNRRFYFIDTKGAQLATLASNQNYYICIGFCLGLEQETTD